MKKTGYLISLRRAPSPLTFRLLGPDEEPRPGFSMNWTLAPFQVETAPCNQCVKETPSVAESQRVVCSRKAGPRCLRHVRDALEAEAKSSGLECDSLCVTGCRKSVRGTLSTRIGYRVCLACAQRCLELLRLPLTPASAEGTSAGSGVGVGVGEDRKETDSPQ